MTFPIRPSVLLISALLAGLAHGQWPYVLHVSGQVEGCSGDAMVTVQTMPGTTPAQSLIIPVDANCQFQAFLHLGSASGGVFAYSSCSNGTMAGDSTAYAIGDPGDTGAVQLSLHCGGTASGNCQACLSVTQAAAFSAQFTSCSSGGTPPYTSIWLLPDGTISLDANPVYQFSNAGAFGVCMQSSDATGCTSVACDTVFVGADGTINPPEAPNCLAGFWPLQAVVDSSNGGGMVEPVPYEVWVWNLSSAADGIDSYSWSFGDGATSAEAYPTHVYDGAGPYVLCLTITNSNCSDSYCDTISISDEGMLNGLAPDGHPLSATFTRSGGFTLNVIPGIPTGIAEPAAMDGLRLWPNPAGDQLNLSLRNSGAGKVPVTVMDLTGKTVMASSIGLAKGTNQAGLDISSLPEGLYMVRIGSGDRVVTQRFVKLR